MFISLGFSVGDELGFKDSLSNTDTNRRRTAHASPFIAQAALAQAQSLKSNVSLQISNSYDALIFIFHG